LSIIEWQGNTEEHRYFTDVRTEIDAETGEVRVSAPADTHYVRSYAQDEAYKERESFRGRQVDFTFAAMEAIHEVIDVLTTAQCGYLLVLQCYVDYDSGTLINADKTPMVTSDMIEALQLKRKRQTFYDFLRACLESGIMSKSDDGRYGINPRYHFRGVTRNKAVVRSYTAMVRQVYRSVKAVDLGLMYRMLPYVHYGTNALCTNPLERDPKKIRWFNGRELAEAIGVDEKTLIRRLPRMVFGEEYVVARLKVGDVDGYFFNPNVFYRKDTRPDDTLLSMFNVKYRSR
jgi:hypothetical protein